jgi:hypothetical protein
MLEAEQIGVIETFFGKFFFVLFGKIVVEHISEAIYDIVDLNKHVT